jgi:hypothetical protein
MQESKHTKPIKEGNIAIHEEPDAYVEWAKERIREMEYEWWASIHEYEEMGDE